MSFYLLYFACFIQVIYLIQNDTPENIVMHTSPQFEWIKIATPGSTGFDVLNYNRSGQLYGYANAYNKGPQRPVL